MQLGHVLLVVGGAFLAAGLLAFGAVYVSEAGRCFPPSLTHAQSWPVPPLDADIKHISANGIDFAYVEAGNGPLVLLLHGYPETPIVWAKIMPALAQAGYHAVAPYMRGYPPTSAPADADYSVRALGQDALALITALGYERATIIGHDWGATAAYAAAVRKPQMIDKLVAVSIPHPIALEGDPSALVKARHFLFYQLPFMEWWLTTEDLCHIDGIFARWAPGWVPPQTVLASVKKALRTNAGFHNALGYYWSFFKRRPAESGDLKGRSLIDVPTLVIAGESDGAVDRARFDKASAGFTGYYEFAAFAKSGHFPEMEEAERFNHEVLRFLTHPAP
jgi:pimeloyl-ACP methyl ester carboxylesterase